MFDDMTEFYNKIGEIAEDGKMVRRITQEVKDYFESSLLWLGADPFSKRKNPDGTYHNIDKSMIVSYSKANNGDKLSAEDQKKYIIDMAIDESIISLSQSNITKQIKERSKTQDKMFNKFILAFMAAYGTKLGLSFTYKEGDTLTDVQQEEMVTALAKLDLKNDTPPDPILAFAKGLTTRKEDGSFTAFVPEANAVAANFVVLPKVEAERVYGELKKVPTEEQITFLNKRAELGDSYLKLKRDETKRMYKVAMGTKADDAILNSIDGMEGSVLEAFMKQYAGDALLKFGPTCTKCGDDKHIEMRSSIQTGTKEDEVTSLGEVPSIASVARQMDRRGFGLGGN